MNNPLQQITNQISSIDLKTQYLSQIKQKQNPFKHLKFNECIFINSKIFNFGQCLPTTVHQKKLGLNVITDLPLPITLTMDIRTEDQELSKLSQFVFAVRKDKQYQYSDFCQFKIQKRGYYEFIIGVKTPLYHFYDISSKMYISAQQMPGQYIETILRQTVVIPKIVCCKELIQLHSQKLLEERVIKFSQIKGKSKKQTKVPFKLENQMKFSMSVDLIGIQDDFSEQFIEVKPKQLTLYNKGQFVVTYKFNFPQSIIDWLENAQKKSKQGEQPCFTVRKILIMKVNQTNFHYHFPIEVNYFLGSKKQIQTIQLGESSNKEQ